MQKLLWTSQRDAQLLTPSLSLYQWDLKSGMVLEVSVTKTHGRAGAVSCQPLVLVLCVSQSEGSGTLSLWWEVGSMGRQGTEGKRAEKNKEHIFY